MSFLFALLQLVSFASLDSDAAPAAGRGVDRENIHVAAPSKADLVQRPMIPCTGTACR